MVNLLFRLKYSLFSDIYIGVFHYILSVQKNTPSVSKISLPLQKHFIYNKFFIFFTSFAIISNIILEKGEVALSNNTLPRGNTPAFIIF